MGLPDYPKIYVAHKKTLFVIILPCNKRKNVEKVENIFKLKISSSFDSWKWKWQEVDRKVLKAHYKKISFVSF